MTLPAGDPLYTIDELAEILHVTPGALRVQRHRGLEPGNLGVTIGRHMFYRVRDIDDFIDRKFDAARRERVPA